MAGKPVLVGDVGGTNVRFALAFQTADGITVEQFKKYPGDSFPDFYSVLREYLNAIEETVDAACFALAGPVANNAVTLTNRAWTVGVDPLKQTFGLEHAVLINDFVGMARAVPEYGADQFEVLYPGRALVGTPTLVAGPGTGFGVATLVSLAGGRWHVFNGEGGHMAFAPRTEFEVELARLLLRDHGYVSNELVAAGIGLESLHKAVAELMGQTFEPLAPDVVNARAKAGDEMCRKIMAIRANTVMSAVGSLVLANGARSGVVLVGGVTEHLLDYVQSPEAKGHFYQRGIQSGYMEKCPVSFLRAAEAPLIGAAAYFFQEMNP